MSHLLYLASRPRAGRPLREWTHGLFRREQRSGCTSPILRGTMSTGRRGAAHPEAKAEKEPGPGSGDLGVG
jgi:hypothetical protein